MRRPDLSRSLRLGDRTVQVSIASLRTEERRPVFITTWEPARPQRMSIEAVETVARFRAQAIDELGAEWRQLQESTT